MKDKEALRRIGELEHQLEHEKTTADKAVCKVFDLEYELMAAETRIGELDEELAAYRSLGLSFK